MNNQPVRRVLTGMRTTGSLHLGHYVGALKLWIDAQKTDSECFFLLADVQALTTHAENSALIRNSVTEVVLDWIAAGIDPTRKNVNFVLQSDVKARADLSLYFMMIAKFGEVERNPTVKDEMRGNRNPSMGFLTYPVDQAADIYMISPVNSVGNRLLIPVGADQAPHLEYSRELARRFNSMYNTDIFLPCTAEIGEIGRLVGIDGQEKMSKSKGNAIDLSDSSEEVTRKIMKMYTDPNRKRATDPGKVEGNPMFMYFDAFADDKEEVAEYKKLYQKGKVGDVPLKQRLAKIINNVLEPMRERRLEAEKLPLGDIVRVGTARASEISEEVVEKARVSMGLGYPR